MPLLPPPPLPQCRALNAVATIVQTSHGVVPLEELLPHTDTADAAVDNTHAHDAATCTDPTHDHSDQAHGHSGAGDPTHDHGHDAATCTDPTHDHSHAASHAAAHDAATCSDPTHDHSHDAATCTDPTHDHSGAGGARSTAEDYGFTNFIYSARRPFVESRLLEVARWT